MEKVTKREAVTKHMKVQMSGNEMGRERKEKNKVLNEWIQSKITKNKNVYEF